MLYIHSLVVESVESIYYQSAQHVLASPDFWQFCDGSFSKSVINTKTAHTRLSIQNNLFHSGTTSIGNYYSIYFRKKRNWASPPGRGPKLNLMTQIDNLTPRIRKSCCSPATASLSQKASHGNILGTKRGIIDPLVSKRPKKFWIKNKKRGQKW